MRSELWPQWGSHSLRSKSPIQIRKSFGATLTLMFSVKRGLMVKPSDHAGAIREGCVQRPIGTDSRRSWVHRPIIYILDQMVGRIADLSLVKTVLPSPVQD